MTDSPSPGERYATTDVQGLDAILNGGFARSHVYLIQGLPGTGKTTLALQFVRAGADRGERCLYITLSESVAELRANAGSHGWDLNAIELVELSATEDILTPDEQSVTFHPYEVELGDTMRSLFRAVVDHNPERVVIDSLSELRMLAQTSLRYRRQILALRQFFADRRCTVLLLDDETVAETHQELSSIVHGVLMMEQLSPEYGAERRRLRVSKYRGQSYRGGYHDYRLLSGGMVVFPRLVAVEQPSFFNDGVLSSAIVELDALLGGGLTYGTSTLISGPAGAGKSSLALCYAAAAARQGLGAAYFTFDESLAVLQSRAASIGMDIAPLIASGQLYIQQIDPAELSPGEFIELIRTVIERNQTRLVVIDSLNGYLNAMPEEHFLVIQLHELFTYLGQRGIATVLIVGQAGIVGQTMTTPIELSYLADTMMLLRYFESRGTVRQAISVVKRRSGPHERTIRELAIDATGIKIGAALTDFQGVLTGTPVYLGGERSMIVPRDDDHQP